MKSTFKTVEAAWSEIFSMDSYYRNCAAEGHGISSSEFSCSREAFKALIFEFGVNPLQIKDIIDGANMDPVTRSAFSVSINDFRELLGE